MNSNGENGKNVIAFLNRWGALVRTIMLLVLAVLGFWLKAKLTDFKQEELAPLRQLIITETHEREVLQAKLEAADRECMLRQQSSYDALRIQVNDLIARMDRVQQSVNRIYEEAVPRAK